MTKIFLKNITRKFLGQKSNLMGQVLMIFGREIAVFFQTVTHLKGLLSRHGMTMNNITIETVEH